LFSALFCFPQYFNSYIDQINSQLSWSLPHIPNKSFNMGLDVKGGVHLEYQADLSSVPENERTSVMEGVKDLIERRINTYGVAEPQIQVSGENRLIVELPGIDSIQEAIDWIGATPWLSFAEPRSQEETDAIIAKAKELQGKTSEEILKIDNYELGLQNPYFKETELSGKHLTKATLSFDQTTGAPIVLLKFNDEGAKIFEQITERNVGKISPFI